MSDRPEEEAVSVHPVFVTCAKLLAGLWSGQYGMDLDGSRNQVRGAIRVLPLRDAVVVLMIMKAELPADFDPNVFLHPTDAPQPGLELGLLHCMLTAELLPPEGTRLN